jgi:hypothetical protein
MHAYLLAGSNKEKINQQIEQLTHKLAASPMEFLISKIDDVRTLNSFTALSLNKKTAVVIKEIENITPEALNAFLKNLEEPQENLFYILTARSLHSVLPTIVSRCQIIKIAGDGQTADFERIEKLLDMKVNQKFAFIDKVKKRDEAVVVMEETLYFLHNRLTEKADDKTNLAKQILASQNTLNNLKANGNVNLQLTNWAINTDITDTFNPQGHQV